MVARIYKPAKTAMSSGNARTKRWILDYEPARPRVVEPLMGWTSSSDMNAQVRVSFDTEQEAVAYAKRLGIAYDVAHRPARKHRVKTYSENFGFRREGLWTH
ncbi:MAG: ETC complex I subunit [Alphaproteobacteria bacterium]